MIGCGDSSSDSPTNPEISGSYGTVVIYDSPVKCDEPKVNDEEENRNGNEDQLEQAKLLIQGSGADSAEGLTFEIFQPEWRLYCKTGKAVYTITVTWNDEKFEIDDSGNAIGIAHYPVNAIGVQEDSLPHLMNNNEWKLLKVSRTENSETVTISQEFEKLEIARAYVVGSYKSKVVTLYSKAFFINPMSLEIDAYTSYPIVSPVNLADADEENL